MSIHIPGSTDSMAHRLVEAEFPSNRKNETSRDSIPMDLRQSESQSAIIRNIWRGNMQKRSSAYFQTTLNVLNGTVTDENLEEIKVEVHELHAPGTPSTKLN